MIRASAFLVAALLCGCGTEPIPPLDVTSPFIRPAPFEVPFTGIMSSTPDFANAKFETLAEVSLRASEEDESHVIATVPEGTPVVLAGTTGGECVCLRVATPQGVGWVYSRYVGMRSFASLE
jgi:hypothetical protein